MAFAPAELKVWLDEAVARFNQPAFIEADPISIPHLFTKKEDIEIAAFIAATLAWGQRKTVLNNATNLMARMDMAPHDFVLHATPADLKKMDGFVHRTFNSTDARYFVRALQHIYRKAGGMEAVFANAVEPDDQDIRNGLVALRAAFLKPRGVQARTIKHFSDVTRGSSAKRLNMFLRWMVRRDNAGVDFGLWRGVQPAQLLCPLDVHTGRVARVLGLLQRKQDDFAAVLELTAALRQLDAADPIRYDIALFGLGAEGVVRP